MKVQPDRCAGGASTRSSSSGLVELDVGQDADQVVASMIGGMDRFLQRNAFTLPGVHAVMAVKSIGA